MKIFYVRPAREGGYGSGDGTSYENAWNGFDAVDWHAMAAAQTAALRVCLGSEGLEAFLTVHVAVQ